VLKLAGQLGQQVCRCYAVVGSRRCDAADELGINSDVVELAERSRHRAGSNGQGFGGAIQSLADLGSGDSTCGQASTGDSGEICHGPGAGLPIFARAGRPLGTAGQQWDRPLATAGMTTIIPTPQDSPHRWRAADLEGIRIALSIPARMAAIRAINDAMAELEEQYPDAIPTARRELDAIVAIDTQLAGLTPEQLQAPIEQRRKAVAADALPEDGTLPIKKADVIEFDTELLREETITRYGSGLSIDAALRRQRSGHAQALLLLLPALEGWSRDPQLSSTGGAFTTALARG